MTSKRLRVVMFSPHYAEYSVRLAMAIGRHASTLLILDRDDRASEVPGPLMQETRRTVSVMEFVSRTRIGRRVSLLTIPFRILMFRPDVVHLQEHEDVLVALVIRIIAPFVKIVLTVHDPEPHSGNDALYAQRMHRFRQILRDAARIYHVHGDFCSRLMAKLNSANKPIVSTAHGVLMVPSREQVQPSEPGRILLFGRMEAYKGIEGLLDALAILTDRGVTFHLVLAGRGPEIDRLKDRLSSFKTVSILHRYISYEEAIEQFQKAAVIVAPYTDATQSGSIAAAFGNNRAVVACKVGGLVDAVRDEVNGLLVPPASADALALALERFLTDPDLRGRLDAGVAEARMTAFNWDVIASRLIETYGTLQR